MSNKLVVILGPTATGKTALSLKLAKKFGGEIVSADSRQVYKGMDIGTGKVTKKGRKGIPHYLLDVASPKKRFSVAQYQKKAIGAIQRILKKDKLPFLVGGSPFYIYAVVEGWSFPELKTDQKLRGKLEKKSVPELFEMLKQLDPTRAKTIEQKNKRRLIRAIEIAQQLGRVPKLKKNPRFECLLLGIKLPKNELQERISNRIDKMIKSGLKKEVKKLSRKYGFNSMLKESIGYQEWQHYSGNKIHSKKTVADARDRDEMLQMNKKEIVEKIKEKIRLNTYHFAKRQMTWFKREKRIHWIKNYKEAIKLVDYFVNK